MFWKIPVSRQRIITTTPVGVKSITHLFVENRNGLLFRYKGYMGGVGRNCDIDTFSVTIGGKLIANNVPALPFCTSSPRGANVFRWQDVALEVNQNVDLSEVIIETEGLTIDGDYNIVLVTDDKECDGMKGFDYVEWKLVKVWNSLINKRGVRWEEIGEEKSIKLLMSPRKFFISAYISQSTKKEGEGDTGVKLPDKALMASDVPMLITIGSDVREVLPPQMDAVVLTTSDDKPWRKVATDIEEGDMTESVRYKLEWGFKNAENLEKGMVLIGEAPKPSRNVARTFDMMLIFIYKKLI